MSNPARKTIRTFKNREEARAALLELEAKNIEGVIEDLQAPPGSGLVVEGVRITVKEEDAERATNLMLRRSREADASYIKEQERERKLQLRHRSVRRPQLPILLVLASALVASAFVIYFALRFFSKRPTTSPEVVTERTWYEDVNRDGKEDVKRYSSIAGMMVQEELDTDFDGKMDLKSRLFNGRLRERWRDIDKDGIYDEQSYYDSRNRLQYVQVNMANKGPINARYIYYPASDSAELQEAIEKELEATGGYPEGAPNENQVILYQAFFDDDEDGNFDRQVKYDFKGAEISTKKLEPGAPENRPLPIKPDE